METPRPNPSSGAWCFRQVLHVGLIRTRGRVRRLECNSPAGGLCCRERIPTKNRFPDGTWTSIAVLFNPHMGLHRDIQNMIGQPNHAIALGDFTGGRVRIEDDEGDSVTRLATKKGERELRGRWLDMHDKPVSFDARRYHMVEPHQGSMWALAAYVPQAYARATDQHRQALREAGFPLPTLQTERQERQRDIETTALGAEEGAGAEETKRQ